MTDARDDEELLRRTAAGDHDAFDEIVDRHAAAVFRLTRSLTRDGFTAEDAMQEAFLAVWQHAGDFRGETSPKVWMMTIARNSAHRTHRRRSGEPSELEPLEELGLNAGWSAGDSDLVDALEKRERVERGFRGLDLDDREILILRDAEGLSGAEVASILGLSSAAMKSRLHRARLRFMANLREVSS